MDKKEKAGPKGDPKGKGKGGKGPRCWTCGKMGHKSDTCWSRPNVRSVEEGGSGDQAEAAQVEVRTVWTVGAVEVEKQNTRMHFESKAQFEGLSRDEQEEEGEEDECPPLVEEESGEEDSCPPPPQPFRQERTRGGM